MGDTQSVALLPTTQRAPNDFVIIKCNNFICRHSGTVPVTGLLLLSVKLTLVPMDVVKTLHKKNPPDANYQA